MRGSQCWTWQCWHLVILKQTKCMSLLQCHFCPYSRAINSVLLTHCTGLNVTRCCLPCQMMMWLWIVRCTLGLWSITLKRITRLLVFSAQQHWWYCAAFLISLCHWVTEKKSKAKFFFQTYSLGSVEWIKTQFVNKLLGWKVCVCACVMMRAHTRLWKLH